jgi:hypothetical protein
MAIHPNTNSLTTEVIEEYWNNALRLWSQQ